MDKKVRHIALFFGSFNPIHLAHLSIAKSVLEQKWADEVWFVVSPQNPHKTNQGMAPAELRLKWIEICLKDLPNILACDVELSLTQPSYTINTLEVLQKQHSHVRFSILMGEDNIAGFETWKNYQDILKYIEHLFVYPRKKGENTLKVSEEIQGRVIWIENPLWPISATDIRGKIKQGASLEGLLPSGIEGEVRDFYGS